LAALREAIEKRGYVREKGTHRLTSREMLRCDTYYDGCSRGRDMELP